MVYTTEEIRERILPIAQKHGLRSVYLFGSYARGTANDASDVDLLIDTAGTDVDTLFKLGAVYEELANALGKSVDLVTMSALEQTAARQSEIPFRDAIMRERMSVYAIA